MADIEKIYDWPEEGIIPRLRAVIEGQGLSMAAMSRELRDAHAERARIIAVIRGEVYKTRYRTWPQLGDGNRAVNDEVTRHCDALADWLEETHAKAT